MNYKEIIPFRALRKFDEMCLHNEYLHQNKELQQQLLSWAAELLEEARKDWSDIHATTFEAIVAEDRKERKPKSVAKPEITNMRHLENILSKSREKSLLNIKRQDKSLLQTDT